MIDAETRVAAGTRVAARTRVAPAAGREPLPLPSMVLPQVGRLRTLHGLSAAAWVGDGLHRVGPSHWLALSGATHPDYNLALVHGGQDSEQRLDECVRAIATGRRPAILVLAGAARTSPTLPAIGWRLVGGAPLMARDTGGTGPDPLARRLAADEYDGARTLVAEVFGLAPSTARVAVPDEVHGVDRDVWAMYDDGRLLSCLLAVHVDESVVIWSMATSTTARRRGFGLRLLDSVLADAHRRGTQIALLHASAAGEPFYAAAGFEVVERWDFWSRPRWVLAAG